MQCKNIKFDVSLSLMQDLCEESLDCSSLKYKYEYKYKHQVLQFELHAMTVRPKSNHYRWSRMNDS